MADTHVAPELLEEIERLKGGIERVRANWPHIEVPIGPSRFLHGKRPVADPGAPTCLRCKIEALLAEAEGRTEGA